MITLLKKSLLIFLMMPFAVIPAKGGDKAKLTTRAATWKQKTAKEATIWGMPLVAMDAMRQAYFRDAKAEYNDVVYLSKGWKNQITTPNSSSNYLYFNYNLSKGPVVVEIPAADGGGVFGSLNNAWQRPLVDYGPKGEDQGHGGKYLIIPPDYKEKTPGGYIQVKSDTLNGYSVLRAIPISNSDEDVKWVWSLADKLKIYPLSEAEHPRNMRFIDMRERVFDGIAKMDETYFESLSRMINEEPILPQDMARMGAFKTLGLEKGKLFKVGDNAEMLRAGVKEAHEYFMAQIETSSVPWFESSRWGTVKASALGAKTGFSFKTAKGLDYEARGLTFFMACAPPKKLGEATLYLGATKDSVGQEFSGENTYRLHVLPDVPAAQFWAVNVYDLETAGFFRDAPVVGVDSYNQQMVKNPDGSVDIFFGPKPPAGKEQNWIYTAPGKRWFAFFRFYGPKPEILKKIWPLPDIEKISNMKQANNE